MSAKIVVGLKLGIAQRRTAASAKCRCCEAASLASLSAARSQLMHEKEFMLEIDEQSGGHAEVVSRQLEAYNARDIEKFMSFWASDAEVFAWPSELLAKGSDQIRARHIERFKEPDLFASLISRVAVGGVVVDREIVTRNFPQGRGKLDVIGIYEVENGRIRRVWFKQGVPIFES